MSLNEFAGDIVIVCEGSRRTWAQAVTETLRVDHEFGAVNLLVADSASPAEMFSTVRSIVAAVTQGGACTVLVSEDWGSSRIESYAVTTGLSLGVPVFHVAPEGASAQAVGAITTISDYLQSSLSTSGVDDSSPDENREERPHEEAARIVLGPRGAYYDHPFDNFARTAHIWTGVLYSKLREGESVSPEDVSLCMVGVKLAREAFRHKRDNLTDAHGYLLTLEMVQEERDRRERSIG